MDPATPSFTQKEASELETDVRTLSVSDLTADDRRLCSTDTLRPVTKITRSVKSTTSHSSSTLLAYERDLICPIAGPSPSQTRFLTTALSTGGDIMFGLFTSVALADPIRSLIKTTSTSSQTTNRSKTGSISSTTYIGSPSMDRFILLRYPRRRSAKCSMSGAERA